MKQKNKPYLTPNEVANLLMISPITVRQLAQKGELVAEATPGGHRRFLRHEVDRFAQRRGLTLLTTDDDTLRILIVDDDKQFTNLLLEILKAHTPAVTTEISHDGFDAGMKIHSFRPNIVLLDIMMPKLNGIEVCHVIKNNQETRGIRIIGITGSPEQDNVKKIIDAGAEICLRKPINSRTLLNTIGIFSNIKSAN